MKKQLNRAFHTDIFNPPKVLKLQDSLSPKIRVEPFNLSHSKDLFEILKQEPTIWKYFPTKQPKEWSEFEEIMVAPVC
jgi:hypothetical protein